MKPSLRQQQTDQHQRHRRIRIHHVVTSIVVITILAFSVSALLLLKSQGITGGYDILAVISIVVTVVIGLLSLLFAFLQWNQARPSNAPAVPTSVSSRSYSAHADAVTNSRKADPAQKNGGEIPTTLISKARENDAYHDYVARVPAVYPPSFLQEYDIEGTLPRRDAPPSSNRAGASLLWNIPYPRNPFFIGRDELLAQLHQQLHSGQATALSQPQAISGLGGIGKTQLAVEYAFQYRHDYQTVLWTLADSRESFVLGYIAIAKLLNLPEKEAQEQARVIEAVKTWLQMHRDWLLILDNADEPDLVLPFLPPVLGGHLLLTTRASALGRLAHRLEVETFSPALGALFVLRRAGIIAPDAELAQALPQDQELAVQIVQNLGGLPLALDQAGGYLETTGCGLLAYQRLYQQRSADLMREYRGVPTEHPPAATTWSLSFARVEEKNPAAAELLRFCAFLAADTIPEEFLTERASKLSVLLAPLATDAYQLDQAIEALRAYSLIKRDPVARTLAVHRLVQEVMRNALSVETQHEWMQRVVQVVNATFPIVSVESWPACERVLPHALLCTNWIEQARIASPEAARLLNQTASYLKARYRYKEAEPLYQRTLAIRERVLGPEHPDTARSLNDLGQLYRMLGRDDRAEPLFKRALGICEQVLGPEHPDTATILNNLAAMFYHARGKFEEAEPLYQRALAIRERMLGPEHPDTAQSLDNLGRFYRALGKYEKAEPLFKRALGICERVLGPEHPDTGRSLNNLGFLYYAQGKYEGVEPLFKRALAIDEQVLGPEHPYAAWSLNNLGQLYHAQGKDEEAEPLLQRALEIDDRVLGPEHPTTQIIRANYQALLQQRG